MAGHLRFPYRQKRKVSKIIPFGIVGLLFGVVYAFLERGLLGTSDTYATGNPYNLIENSIFTIFQSCVMGLIFGTIEVLVLDKIFSKKSFANKFLFKSIIYISTILFFVAAFSMLSISIIQDVSLFHPLVFTRLLVFLKGAGFWSIMMYVGMVFSIAIFLSELSDHLGQNALKNFLFGKYHKTRQEEIIFMFMDIKSSTTVAEKLGHVQYFKFLNEYYADITEAIIESRGEIYQYVGDEVVISWRLKDGLPNQNCLRCFFMSKEIIRSHAKKYMKEFGMIPEFKPGIHYGKVTTGRIGVIKKEIIFTGDVLNTTARIQSVCNQHKVDNLVSSDLLSILNSSREYSAEEFGNTQLRGKEESVKLYTIKPSLSLN